MSDAARSFVQPRTSHAILVLTAALLVAVMLALPPIVERRDFVTYADQRALFGVPNFMDVVSNVAFAIVGVWGLAVVLSRSRNVSMFVDDWERWPWAVLFGAVNLTAVGSAYYHLAPDGARLAWDRAPMTLAFMGLLTAVMAERVGVRVARRLFVPLLLLGPASVAYWRWTDVQGAADLRPYVLVQFGSLVLIALMWMLYRPRYTGAQWLALGLGLYAVAKLFEVFDRAVFAWTGGVSGHTIKHLVAAAAVACAGVMIGRRSRVARGE